MNLPAGVAAAALDAYEDPTAVLDGAGVIVGTNELWLEADADGGRPAPSDDAGTSYVDACDGDDKYGRRAADGLRALLDGDDDHFSLEYPCHTPERKRWSLLRADRFTHDSDTYVVVTHTDVTDHVAAEVAANQRYDRMLSVASYVSHDLRNPLTIARGWLETVMEGGDPAELERVERALKRMDGMISGAVELLRVERDGLERQSLDLEVAARSAWEFHVDATDATLEIADSCELATAPALFERVLANLFRNAVTHAGPDVTVTVGTTPDGFYVADDGPGVDPDYREKIFDVGFTTERGSTGLGLAFVREATAIHGWTVDLTDAAGGGARFDFHTRPETPGLERRDVPDY